jgi:integrase
MKSLEWHDMGTEAIRRRAENSKNKKQRVLPLRGELAEIVKRAKDKRNLNALLFFTIRVSQSGIFVRHGKTPASVSAWAILRRSVRNARPRKFTTGS